MWDIFFSTLHHYSPQASETPLCPSFLTHLLGEDHSYNLFGFCCCCCFGVLFCFKAGFNLCVTGDISLTSTHMYHLHPTSYDNRNVSKHCWISSGDTVVSVDNGGSTLLQPVVFKLWLFSCALWWGLLGLCWHIYLVSYWLALGLSSFYSMSVQCLSLVFYWIVDVWMIEASNLPCSCLCHCISLLNFFQVVGGSTYLIRSFTTLCHVLPLSWWHFLKFISAVSQSFLSAW